MSLWDGDIIQNPRVLREREGPYFHFDFEWMGLNLVGTSPISKGD